MNNINFRKLMASIFQGFNAFYGDNVGTFDIYNYKINYQDKGIDDTEGQRTYQIDIDVWCKSTEEKENICNQVESLLNSESYPIGDDLGEFIFLNRYNADEKNIYRTTMSYELRTWSKGEN